MEHPILTNQYQHRYAIIERIDWLVQRFKRHLRRKAAFEVINISIRFDGDLEIVHCTGCKERITDRRAARVDCQEGIFHVSCAETFRRLPINVLDLVRRRR